ncbi:YcnI family protein [Rhizobium sp. CG5]|uniref:YcnI family copper-binding membrane protein n=1 Tax=Rhizobium sp. CG5 TaxID=2726076 RepID=UPI0020336D24|nr:YcnI family protein [Rhizobium sp. CG5]MCM2474999.1 YcnI family protein [Rhizobium sp. CG5]
MKAFKSSTFIAVAIMAVASAAQAHVTLENKDVAPGATVKFVLRLPHGCSGSATTGLRIAIPEQLTSVKPQPKPGWNLSIATDELHKASAETAHAHGGAAQVKEVSWTGGKLEDAYYDEFVFRATVSKTATDRIFVPIVQECESGTDRWIEIPAAGASSDDLKYPAPSVRVQP